MPRFAVLMYEDAGAWSRLPKAKRAALLRKYGSWLESLREQGVFAGGSPLASSGVRLRKRGSKIVEEPYRSPKERLTGWFLLEAPDLPEATKIARGCPALLHGERVVVLPTEHPG